MQTLQSCWLQNRHLQRNCKIFKDMPKQWLFCQESLKSKFFFSLHFYYQILDHNLFYRVNKVRLKEVSILNHLVSSLHRGAFCLFTFRWIYYYGSNKSTGKETGTTHLCALVWKGRMEIRKKESKIWLEYYFSSLRIINCSLCNNYSVRGLSNCFISI